jgi:deferrochelatase/peroxidase EfeB
MISPEYNFKHFVEATKKKDAYEIICLAEQEAIGAWRRSYRSVGSVNDDDQKSLDYQNRLKNLIYHMRSHVRPSNIEDPCKLNDNNN